MRASSTRSSSPRSVAEGAIGAPTVRLDLWLVGFGTVGQWLARALARDREALARQGLELAVVAIATARDGFVHDPGGIDLEAALDLRAAGEPLAGLPGATQVASALEGMRETRADVLVEAALSPAVDGQPGADHMREALGRGIATVTSNKWPVAIAGTELSLLARSNGAPFRAESTVMSGTPVVGPLTAGLAGAQPRRIRGVLNATNSFICTGLDGGRSYAEALAEAKELGLAEPDPSADVDGLDTASKLMVLSALVLGEALELADVEIRGISALEPAEIEAAREGGRVLREVAVLDPAAGIASVTVQALDPEDPLAAARGTTNVITCEAEPLGTIAISGPGAGPALAGQGVLADLIGVAGELRRRGL